jgi:hypothetical protein
MTKNKVHASAASMLAAVAFLAVGPSGLWAQEPAGPPAPETPGPTAPAAKEERHLTIERIQNGFLVAPDNKFTEIDGRYGNLLGFYAGYMMDRTLFIGAGGYWLTNGSHDREMGYGGGVFEWLVHGDRRFGLSARALIGGGSATLTSTVTGVPVPPYPVPYWGGNGPGGSWGAGGPGWPDGGWPGNWPDGWPTRGTGFLRTHDDFFVAEPQLDVSWKITGWIHLNAGGGYRFIAGTRDMDHRLRGASGSLSVQFGGGS